MVAYRIRHWRLAAEYIAIVRKNRPRARMVALPLLIFTLKCIHNTNDTFILYSVIHAHCIPLILLPVEKSAAMRPISSDLRISACMGHYRCSRLLRRGGEAATLWETVRSSGVSSIAFLHCSRVQLNHCSVQYFAS